VDDDKEVRKQDWSTRLAPVERSIAHWPRLKELIRAYHYDARPLLDEIIAKPYETIRDVKLQLDDILWLVEGDCDHDPLCYENEALWKETKAALEEFPGERV